MNYLRCFLFWLSGREHIRYQWNIVKGGAIVVIHHPTAPHNWRIEKYHCSDKSALRLIALAKRHPCVFQGYY